MKDLLPWQKDCLAKYDEKYDLKDVFVVVAGTGAGKTCAGAAMVAKAFMREADKDPIIIVAAPFRSIKRGWQKWLKNAGITRTTTNNNNAADPSLEAIICTYASAAEMLKLAERFGRPVILVLDEFHHLEAEGKWTEPYADMRIGEGCGVIKAILLSGTPWHETGELPSTLVDYDADGLVKHDKYYTYGEAVNEDDENRNVVTVEIDLIDGTAYQQGVLVESGEIVQGREFDTRNMQKTDPLTPFVDFDASSIHKYDAAREVVDKAVARLNSIRSQDGTEYVGGILIARQREQADALKRYLREVHGKDAIVVLSDDPKAHDAIEVFEKAHDQEWIIAVDMISEGVDVPRLKVLGDLTNKRTMLHIIQRWGRVLRRVRKANGDFAINSSAHIFCINHPMLREMAERIEKEVNKAREDKGPPGPPPPPSSVAYQTISQDYNGTLVIAHGEREEERVAALAQWLWDKNYHSIRSGRRGHTDCLWIAREMLAEGRTPKNYTADTTGEEPKAQRNYDQEKSAAIEALTAAVGRLAHAMFNGEYNNANAFLNERQGLRSWKSSAQPIEKIVERTELAKRYAAMRAA